MGGFVLRPRGKGTSCYKYELETKSAGKRVCELGALADNEKYKPDMVSRPIWVPGLGQSATSEDLKKASAPEHLFPILRLS